MCGAERAQVGAAGVFLRIRNTSATANHRNDVQLQFREGSLRRHVPNA